MWLFAVCLAPILLLCDSSSPLLITGVIRGPLSFGLPQAVELYASSNISNLSQFALAIVSDGSPNARRVSSFPAQRVVQGTYIYFSRESASFLSWFGFAANYFSANFNVSGADCIQLFLSSTVIDQYGSTNLSSAAQGWNYTRGWAYRHSGTAPSANFSLADWQFSGSGVLTGQSTNAGSSAPFPVASYSPPAADWKFSAPVEGALAAGLKGHWPLDGDFSDISSSAFHSSFVGSPSFVPGKGGQAALFSGADYIQVTVNSIVSSLTSWSIGAWFRTSGTVQKDQYIFSIQSAGYNWAAIGITGVAGPQVTCQWLQQGLGGQKVLGAAANVSAGQWHYLLCAYDAKSATLRLYYDGLQVASVGLIQAMQTPVSPTIQIAASNGTTAAGQWVGALDAIMLWNYSVSPVEALKLYEGYALMGAEVFCQGNITAGDTVKCAISLYDDFGSQLTDNSTCKLVICPVVDGNGLDTALDVQHMALGNGSYEMHFRPVYAGVGSFSIHWDGTLITTYFFNVSAGLPSPQLSSVSCTMAESGLQCRTTLVDQFNNFIKNCTQDFGTSASTCV